MSELHFPQEPQGHFYDLRTVLEVETAPNESPPLQPLPLSSLERSDGACGPENVSEYATTLRYLESCPVVLSVIPPREVRGGVLREFYSDAKYLWSNVELSDLVRGSVRLRWALVERADLAHGVGPALDPDQLREAGLSAFEILNQDSTHQPPGE